MTEAPSVSLEWMASGGFGAWLHTQESSIVLTGYQSGLLIAITARPGGQVRVAAHPFVPCMGCQYSEGHLYVGTRRGLWSFRQEKETFRASRCWLTGDVKVHDVGVDPQGKPYFVNTLCNCVVTPAERGLGWNSLWKPSFISSTEPGDRCHLNGLAMREGRPRYATCIGATDQIQGWREHRVGGGILLDIASDATLLEGLSMPHSPRFVGQDLWLHDSAQGWFGRADLKRGLFEPRTFAPGFLRGLDFLAGKAVAGVSRLRYFGTQPLPLGQELERQGKEARCGVCVMDPDAAEIVHGIFFDSLEEVYDLAIVPIPGIRLRFQ